LKEKYIKQKDYKCNIEVDVILPRCRHEKRLNCLTASQLSSWKGISLIGNIIKEGENYGPIDHICNEKVYFEWKCGHRLLMECNKAFEYATRGAIKCKVMEQMINPTCGHLNEIMCHEKQILSRLNRTKDPITIVEELNPDINYLSLPYQIKHQCKEKVTQRRKCGHEKIVECCTAKIFSAECDMNIQAINPLCLHSINISCKYKDFENWSPWGDMTTNSYSLLCTGILEENVDKPVPPPKSIENIVLECKEKLIIQRHNCEHELEITCKEAFKIIFKNKEFPRCSEKVFENLTCGHDYEMKCWEREEYIKNPTKYLCKEITKKSCWNPLCGKICETVCSSVAFCNSKSNWFCQEGHELEIVCKNGIPTDCPTCSSDRLTKEIENENKNEPDITNLFKLPKEILMLEKIRIDNENTYIAFVEKKKIYSNEL